MILFERFLAIISLLALCYWIFRSAWLDHWIKSKLLNDDRQTDFLQEEAERLATNKKAVVKAVKSKKKALQKEVEAVKDIKP
jgi:hypothetical protein